MAEEETEPLEALAQKLQSAEALVREHRFDEAIPLLWELMADEPEKRRPWLTLARALAATQDPEQAEAVLIEAQGHLPNQPMLFIEHARQAEKRADWMEAERRWANIRIKFPTHADGWRGGIQCLCRVGQVAQADALASEGLIRFATDRSVAFAWADLPKWDNQWSTRAQRWQEVKSRLPEEPGSYIGSALSALEAGNVADATELSEAGCERFRENAEMQRARGIVLIRTDKPAEADKALTKALALAPHDALTAWYHVRAALELKEWRTAAHRIADAQKRHANDDRFGFGKFAVPAEVDLSALANDGGSRPHTRRPESRKLRRLFQHKQS